MVAASHEAGIPDWFAQLAGDLDAADARAATLLTGLTPAQLNWKPNPGTWSVGQCLEHLCLSNEVYVIPISQALAETPTAPVDEIAPGWFARWFIQRYIEPSQQKRPARAPRKVSPVASALDLSIGERFTASNDAIRSVMARAREVDVNRVRFRNPFVPVIRFTVGTGLLILARHNHRHLGQAERVVQLPQFPRK